MENKAPWPDSWDLSISSPLIKDPYDEISISYFEDVKKYSLYR